jgi:hypothetical protein
MKTDKKTARSKGLVRKTEIGGVPGKEPVTRSPVVHFVFARGSHFGPISFDFIGFAGPVEFYRTVVWLKA